MSGDQEVRITFNRQKNKSNKGLSLLPEVDDEQVDRVAEQQAVPIFPDDSDDNDERDLVVRLPEQTAWTATFTALSVLGFLLLVAAVAVVVYFLMEKRRQRQLAAKKSKGPAQEEVPVAEEGNETATVTTNDTPSNVPPSEDTPLRDRNYNKNRNFSANKKKQKLNRCCLCMCCPPDDPEASLEEIWKQKKAKQKMTSANMDEKMKNSQKKDKSSARESLRLMEEGMRHMHKFQKFLDRPRASSPSPELLAARRTRSAHEGHRHNRRHSGLRSRHASRILSSPTLSQHYHTRPAKQSHRSARYHTQQYYDENQSHRHKPSCWRMAEKDQLMKHKGQSHVRSDDCLKDQRDGRRSRSQDAGRQRVRGRSVSHVRSENLMLGRKTGYDHNQSHGHRPCPERGAAGRQSKHLHTGHHQHTSNVPEQNRSWHDEGNRRLRSASHSRHRSISKSRETVDRRHQDSLPKRRQQFHSSSEFSKNVIVDQPLSQHAQRAKSSERKGKHSSSSALSSRLQQDESSDGEKSYCHQETEYSRPQDCSSHRQTNKRVQSSEHVSRPYRQNQPARSRQTGGLEQFSASPAINFDQNQSAQHWPQKSTPVCALKESRYPQKFSSQKPQHSTPVFSQNTPVYPTSTCPYPEQQLITGKPQYHQLQANPSKQQFALPTDSRQYRYTSSTQDHQTNMTTQHQQAGSMYQQQASQKPQHHVVQTQQQQLPSQLQTSQPSGKCDVKTRGQQWVHKANTRSQHYVFEDPRQHQRTIPASDGYQPCSTSFQQQRGSDYSRQIEAYPQPCTYAYRHLNVSQNYNCEESDASGEQDHELNVKCRSPGLTNDRLYPPAGSEWSLDKKGHPGDAISDAAGADGDCEDTSGSSSDVTFTSPSCSLLIKRKRKKIHRESRPKLRGALLRLLKHPQHESDRSLGDECRTENSFTDKDDNSQQKISTGDEPVNSASSMSFHDDSPGQETVHLARRLFGLKVPTRKRARKTSSSSSSSFPGDSPSGATNSIAKRLFGLKIKSQSRPLRNLASRLLQKKVSQEEERRCLLGGGDDCSSSSDNHEGAQEVSAATELVDSGCEISTSFPSESRPSDCTQSNDISVPSRQNKSILFTNHCYDYSPQSDRNASHQYHKLNRSNLRAIKQRQIQKKMQHKKVGLKNLASSLKQKSDDCGQTLFSTSVSNDNLWQSDEPSGTIACKTQSGTRCSWITSNVCSTLEGIETEEKKILVKLNPDDLKTLDDCDQEFRLLATKWWCQQHGLAAQTSSQQHNVTECEGLWSEQPASQYKGMGLETFQLNTESKTESLCLPQEVYSTSVCSVTTDTIRNINTNCASSQWFNDQGLTTAEFYDGVKAERVPVMVDGNKVPIYSKTHSSSFDLSNPALLQCESDNHESCRQCSDLTNSGQQTNPASHLVSTLSLETTNIGPSGNQRIDFNETSVPAEVDRSEDEHHPILKDVKGLSHSSCGWHKRVYSQQQKRPDNQSFHNVTFQLRHQDQKSLLIHKTKWDMSSGSVSESEESFSSFAEGRLHISQRQQAFIQLMDTSEEMSTVTDPKTAFSTFPVCANHKETPKCTNELTSPEINFQCAESGKLQFNCTSSFAEISTGKHSRCKAQTLDSLTDVDNERNTFSAVSSQQTGSSRPAEADRQEGIARPPDCSGSSDVIMMETPERTASCSYLSLSVLPPGLPEVNI